MRDPIAVNAAGELICVGEIPEHAALNVLKGRPEWLIAAADQAALACRLPAGAQPLHSLVMDCISRRLFMGARIADELGAIQRRFQTVAPGLPLEGALTLGEIASYGEGYLEFFNKTVVAGLALSVAPRVRHASRGADLMTDDIAPIPPPDPVGRHCGGHRPPLRAGDGGGALVGFAEQLRAVHSRPHGPEKPQLRGGFGCGVICWSTRP